MKKIIAAICIVLVFSSSAFAILPVILGLSLADALIGATVLSVVSANTAYIIARNDSNLGVAQIFPTLGVVRRFAYILWVDKSLPLVNGQQVVKSAPITVDIPIATARQYALVHKSTTPDLYNSFYDPPPAPSVSSNNTMDTRYYGDIVLQRSGPEFTVSYLELASANPDINRTTVTNRLVAYNANGGPCALNNPYPMNLDLSRVAGVSSNPASPSVINYCTSAVQEGGSGYHLTYAPYTVQTAKEKPMYNTINLDASYISSIDKVMVANGSEVRPMDGYNIVTPEMLTGSGLTSLPYAGPITGTAAQALPLTAADVATGVKDAFAPDTAVPDAGIYDGSIIAPVLKNISSLLSSFLTNSPIAGIIKTFTLKTSLASPVVDCGDIYGKPFKFDFSRWQGFLTACGSLLMVIVHGYAILIVMKGWKND